MSSVEPQRAFNNELETPAEETLPEFKEIIVKSEEIDGKRSLLDFTPIELEKTHTDVDAFLLFGELRLILWV